MSGKRSRRKGAAAERELFGLLADELGHPWLRRNLEQYRLPGPDAETTLPLALEVKRAETLQIGRWLKQANDQACPGELVALAFRQSRQPWRFLIEMDLSEFADLLRNLIPDDDHDPIR